MFEAVVRPRNFRFRLASRQDPFQTASARVTKGNRAKSYGPYAASEDQLYRCRGKDTLSKAKQISNHSELTSRARTSGKGRQNDVQLFYSTFGSPFREISAVGLLPRRPEAKSGLFTRKAEAKTWWLCFTNKNTLSILPLYLCHISVHMVIS